ncbi:Peptidyl prolyl cis-trans isomerase, putative [Hondaea fermentalgiana]|uniref:Peptidyl-prolyl cis-trans isomerase n=1 Tax=Hondaea fermentalgiana TaxID=2315210 RepID=A0A2R5GD55_9STRA|nr:Peptidyl prolyl cis-trans isomerase, putative [Hondaea fermentalgiana]|eukprot:GBG28906.1 Peptidyl prolyl cis-trans isomerase, putative [Hondaea fermentalgiana]
MAVLLETSAGNLVVDLYAEKCPTACLNFVKLCKMHYYDGHLFFDVQRNYWMRTGDPTGTGKGGQSVFSLVENKDADDTKAHSKYFADEIVRGAKFDRRGLVCMASTMKDQNGSSFLITMTDHGLEHLNGTRTIFGEIGEGLDSTLAAINELQVDDKYRPLRDVRILCTHVLDDPFPDPPGLPRPLSLPAGARPPQESVEPRIGFDENLDEDFGVSTEELEKRSKARDAKARAVVLEMVGDLPDADMKPPENVLFVCKLNAATQEDDLELIFSRFGEVKSCEIIRDKETGDSLQYAFIEFGNEEQCQEAFFKMNNVMIDDRRIKVDFSQSLLVNMEPEHCEDEEAILRATRSFLFVCQDKVADLRRENADLQDNLAQAKHDAKLEQMRFEDEQASLRQRLALLVDVPHVESRSTREICDVIGAALADATRRADQESARAQEAVAKYEAREERLQTLRSEANARIEAERAAEIIAKELENSRLEIANLKQREEELMCRLHENQKASHKAAQQLQEDVRRTVQTCEAAHAERVEDLERRLLEAQACSQEYMSKARANAADLQEFRTLLESRDAQVEQLSGQVLRLEARLAATEHSLAESEAAVAKRDESIMRMQRHHHLLDQRGVRLEGRRNVTYEI